MDELYVVGRNPVMELLKGNREIDKIYILKGNLQGSIKKSWLLLRRKIY